MTDPELAKRAGMCFYNLPQDLIPEQIDPLIRKAVFRINESGWIWTGESCQGHPDCEEELTPWGLNVHPFLRLICRAENIGKMFSLLISAMRYMDKYGMDSVMGFKVYPCRKNTAYPSENIVDNDKWEEVMIYLNGTNVAERNRSISCFEKFAELVNDINPKEVTITINTRKKTTPGRRAVSYEEVISWVGYKSDRVISVVYCKGPENKPEGILSKGDNVFLKDGMKFDAYDTSNA